MNNLISVFTGVLIAVMLMINGILANETGNYVSSVIIHSVGLISVIVIIFINRTRIVPKKGIPFYLYSAGAIGVFTVLCNNISYSGLGASLTLSLGLLGQLLASVVIDHFGLFRMNRVKFEKRKLMGLAVIISGIIVMAFF